MDSSEQSTGEQNVTKVQEFIRSADGARVQHIVLLGDMPAGPIDAIDWWCGFFPVLDEHHTIMRNFVQGGPEESNPLLYTIDPMEIAQPDTSLVDPELLPSLHETLERSQAILAAPSALMCSGKSEKGRFLAIYFLYGTDVQQTLQDMQLQLKGYGR